MITAVLLLYLVLRHVVYSVFIYTKYSSTEYMIQRTGRHQQVFYMNTYEVLRIIYTNIRVQRVTSTSERALEIGHGSSMRIP